MNDLQGRTRDEDEETDNKGDEAADNSGEEQEPEQKNEVNI